MNYFNTLSIHTLSNGVTLLMLPEKSHKLVSCQVWYKVGAKLETKETKGIAHFIEHLFFKGTAKMQPGEIDLRLNRIGAVNNAATSKDYTFYYVKGLAEHLEEMFNLQAEMLTEPAFRPEDIDRERDVVIAEIHRANDNPARRLHYTICEKCYRQHPYAQPVLGYEENIRNISPETISNWYRTNYNAENTSVIVTGNFEPQQVIELTEKWFGRLPSVKSEPKIIEPVYPVAGDFTIYENTRKNYSSCSWLGPFADQVEDGLSLELLSVILTNRKSSRWVKEFREDASLVEGIYFYYDNSQEQGLIQLSAIVKEDQWTDYHSAIADAVQRLRRFYVSREEIHQAREYMLIQNSYQLQKLEARAQFIAFCATLNQSDLIQTYEQKIRALRQEDIVRVIEKYLCHDPLIVRMLPKESAITPEKEDNEGTVSHKKGYSKKKLGKNLYSFKFDSGLEAVFLQEKESPICSAEVYVKNLMELTSRFPTGSAYLLQKLLARGTKSLNHEKIAELMDGLGARYSTICADNMTRKENYRNSLSAPEHNFWNAFEIFSSFFTEASFPESELKKCRDSILHEIRTISDTSSRMCMLEMMKNYFKGHPFGAPFIGDESSISEITYKDIQEIYTVLYNPAQLFISIAGNFEPEEVACKIQELFNSKLGVLDFKIKKRHIPTTFQSKNIGKTKTVKSPKEQAFMICSTPFPGIMSPDYHTAVVVNEILGCGMSSRYFKTLREEMSLGYEVGCNYVAYRHYGFFYGVLGTSPQRVEEASAAFLRENNRLKTEPVPEDELKKAISLVIASLEMNQETIQERLYRLGNHLSKELSLTFLKEYPEKIKKVTPTDIQKFAEKYFAVQPFEQRVMA